MDIGLYLFSLTRPISGADNGVVIDEYDPMISIVEAPHIPPLNTDALQDLECIDDARSRGLASTYRDPVLCVLAKIY